MRFFKAFKNLIMNYTYIMPTYILAVIAIFVVSHLAPLIGTLLILPVNVGVAYVMINAIKKDRNRFLVPIALGFRPTYYGKNLKFLVLRQVLYLSPLLIGTILSGLFFGLFSELTVDISVVVLNVIIFAIPSAVISLMLAMVPYLLADRRFDQRKYNPLKVSAIIMKGNYLRLIAVRLFFVPWIALQSSSVFVLVLTYYRGLFGGEIPYDFLRPSIFITPLVLLLFTPWYQMMHAELYASLRFKVKNYR